MTAPPPSAPAQAGPVLAAYLAEYEIRRSKRPSRVVFRDPSANALLAVLHERLHARLESPVARAALLEEIADLTREPHERRRPRHAANVSGLVWASLAPRTPAGSPALRRMVRALDAGALRRRGRGASGLGWRAVFLAEARDHVRGSLRDRVDAELGDLMPALLRMVPSGARPCPVAEAAQACTSLATLAERLGRPELRGAARDHLTAQLTSAPGATLDSTTLACLVLAAQATGETAVASDLGQQLLLRRNPERGVVNTSADGRGGIELRPWVPLALLALADDLAPAAAIFEPVAQSLPDFEILAVESTPGRLDFRVRRGSRERVRSFGAQDLDLLVDCTLAQFEAADPLKRSPRQHAHQVLSLEALAGRCEDEPTRAAIAALVHRSLEQILATQEPNGGWSFGRDEVPMISWSARGRAETEFPNLQYTIDAALPGMVLCMAYSARGDERHLAAAERAFAFFEDTIGRVTWNRGRIWRLWPEDRRTQWMGTAVNYELWNACFFACYAGVARDERVRARARQYAHEGVLYARSLMTPEGDILYGDYVRERRTAYASWDAHLLAAIADAIGDADAAEMSRMIVDRLAAALLPSGAMPNVVDHEERVGELARATVHRHGIGPHPVTAYYQLYYVVAAGCTGRQPQAGLRALGFVLLELYDATTPSLSPGTVGDGTMRPSSALMPALDWILQALTLLDRMTDVDYRPVRSNARPGPERLVRVAEDLCAHAEEEATRPAGAELSIGLGAVALARATGEERWRERALAAAESVAGGAASGDAPRACRLLAAAHTLTGDERLAEAARARLGEVTVGAGDSLEGRVAVLEAASAVAALGDQRAAERADAACDAVVALQAAGWWAGEDGRPDAARQALVLHALFRCLERRGAHTTARYRAALEGARAAWAAFFRVAPAESGAVRERAVLTPDALASYAWCYGRIAVSPKRANYGRQAGTILRRLVHDQRDATGAPLEAPNGAPAGAAASAAAFATVAQLAEEAPSWIV